MEPTHVYNVRIWNRRFKNAPEDAIYGGRPSPWGNPYTIGEDCDRHQALEQFTDYAIRRLKAEPDWLEPLKESNDWVCWCAPEDCHLEVLALLLYS